MEKYGNKSPFMKFIHKNTGFIVVGVFLAIAIPVYLFTVESQEFFETWSCSRLQSYLLIYDQDLYKQNYPDHEHLTEEQHTKFHEVLSECNLMFEHR